MCVHDSSSDAEVRFHLTAAQNGEGGILLMFISYFSTVFPSSMFVHLSVIMFYVM